MPQYRWEIIVHADFETLTLGEWHSAPSFSAYYAFMAHLLNKGMRQYVSLQRKLPTVFFISPFPWRFARSHWICLSKINKRFDEVWSIWKLTYKHRPLVYGRPRIRVREGKTIKNYWIQKFQKINLNLLNVFKRLLAFPREWTWSCKDPGTKKLQVVRPSISDSLASSL